MAMNKLSQERAERSHEGKFDFCLMRTLVQTKTRVRPNRWKLSKDIELGTAESQIL